MKRVRYSVVEAVVLFSAVTALADMPGRHPAYLHARSDLRRAERLMEWPEERNVARDLGAAAREAREAIRRNG